MSHNVETQLAGKELNPLITGTQPAGLLQPWNLRFSSVGHFLHIFAEMGY